MIFYAYVISCRVRHRREKKDKLIQRLRAHAFSNTIFIVLYTHIHYDIDTDIYVYEQV